MPNLRTALTMEESQRLNYLTGSYIIISASGMCDAGRIKHHLRHNLWRSDCTVLFVGYQAEGTLGRRILSGEKTVRIHGEQVAVKAEIRHIDGFSAHADQPGLLDWVKNFNNRLKKVFVVHGEPTASGELARLIGETGVEAYIPGWLEKVELAPVTSVQPPAVLVDTWKNIHQKMEKVVQGGLTPAKYSVLLRQMAELEAQLNEAVADEDTLPKIG